MRITYFTDTFLPKLDGVSTSLVTITSALAGKGHKILIFAPRPKNLKEIKFRKEGVYLALLRSIPAFLYPEFRAATPISPKLIMHIRNFKPDLIHFQTTFLVGAGGILLGKIIRKPIIGTFHAHFMQEEYLRIMRINYQTEIISSILWKYALLFYNQCDAILSPSEESGRELKRQGVNSPIFVIPNSIDESRIRKAKDEEVQKLREKLHLKKQVLIYVGRLSAEKCLDVLLKGFSRVCQTNKDTSLLLVGYGPKMNDLKKLAEELGIGGQVVFTGKITQEKLLTEGYYQLGDAFVTASTSEVLPVSLIEAMCFGLPIIGVAKRGVGEVVKGVGLSFPEGNTGKFAVQVEKVIKDKAFRKKLSTNSLTAYEKKYKKEKVAEAYEKLYAQVINNYKKQRFMPDMNIRGLFAEVEQK